MTNLDLSGYTVTDDFFGAPYIDHDGLLDEPTPHRYVHGGFEGTDTRFALRFPVDGSYRGRLSRDHAVARGAAAALISRPGRGRMAA